MELDERLRLLADQVPEPPPGDATATLRRGVGRRRFRRGVGVTAAIALVGVMGGGISVLLDRPGSLEIGDHPPVSSPPASDGAEDIAPPGDAPLITQQPMVTLSGGEPFPWAVAVSATDDGRWCATTTRGSTDLPDPADQPCDDLLTAPDPGEMTWHGSQPDRRPGATARGLSWGLVPAGADTVFVEFTDGTRTEASQAWSSPLGNVALWAIAYEDTDIHAIEAVGDRVHTGIVAIGGSDVFGTLRLVGVLAAAVAVIAAVWWLRRRRDG